MRFSTAAVHTSSKDKGPLEPVSDSIALSSAYFYNSIAELSDAFHKTPTTFYRRYGQQNSVALEKTVAKLEGAEEAVAATTGMGALTTIAYGLLKAGDKILCSLECYGGTYNLFVNDLPRVNVKTTFVPVRNLPAAIRKEKPALVVYESISNPATIVPDFGAISAACRAVGATSVVDNTFATPYHCNPLKYGVSLVYHSGTKFLNGHADSMTGIIAGSRELISRLRKFAINTGLTACPLDSFLTLRGIKTLALRMQRSSENATQIASFLTSKRKIVTNVHHPSLRSADPNRKFLKNGFGAVLSFEIAGGIPAVEKFVAALGLVRMIPSFGDVSTTISHPWSSSHKYLPEPERLKMGVTPGLVRLSVGIEDVEDIIEDLDGALNRICEGKRKMVRGRR